MFYLLLTILIDTHHINELHVPYAVRQELRPDAPLVRALLDIITSTHLSLYFD